MALFTNAYCFRNLTNLICIDKDNLFYNFGQNLLHYNDKGEYN